MTERLPPFSALRAFEAAARHQHLGRAADELHVTHSAVSHQIKLLQEHLGVALTTRRGRGIGLTAAGQQFALRLDDIFQQLSGAIAAAQATRGGRALSVAVLPSFAAKWLLPRLPRFMVAHPEVELSINASLALADLRRDGVDLAIRYGRGSWPGLHAEQLMAETMLAVASPQYRGGALPATAQQVAQATLLSDQSAVGWPEWFAAQGLAPPPEAALSFSDAGLMLQAAVAGQGVALVRSVLAHDDLAAGRLRRLAPPSLPAPFAYYLVTPGRLPPDGRSQVFIEWIRREASACMDGC